MKMGAYLWKLCQLPDKVLVHEPGFQGAQADPPDAGDPVNRPDQIKKGSLSAVFDVIACHPGLPIPAALLPPEVLPVGA